MPKASLEIDYHLQISRKRQSSMNIVRRYCTSQSYQELYSHGLSYLLSCPYCLASSYSFDARDGNTQGVLIERASGAGGGTTNGTPRESLLSSLFLLDDVWLERSSCLVLKIASLRFALANIRLIEIYRHLDRPGVMTVRSVAIVVQVLVSLIAGRRRNLVIIASMTSTSCCIFCGSDYKAGTNSTE